MMIDEQSLDVKPIKLKSEKDLNEEFETCNITLTDTSLDWSKRVKALKRLEGIVLGGAYEFESFPSFMTKLSPHLVAQLNDLRSIVSKEACNLICLAAKLAGQRLDTVCDRLFTKEGLIKLINSGNKILSENGNACVVNLIANVQSQKIIPRIVDELGSKSPSLREKASYYLTKILSIYPAHVIEKQASVIESGIMTGVSDASKESRHHSRQAYFLYSQLFPQRTDKMYERLDPAVQKALQEDYGQDAIVPSMTKRGSCQEEPIISTKAKTPSRTPVSRKQVAESVEVTELSRTEAKGIPTYGIEKKAGRPPTASNRKETETKEKEETSNAKLSPPRESSITPDPSTQSRSQLAGSPSREQLKSSKRKGTGNTPSNKDSVQTRQSLDLSASTTEGVMRSRKGKLPQTVTTQLIDLSSPKAKSEKILNNTNSNSENKMKVVQPYGIIEEPEPSSTKHTSFQNLDVQEIKEAEILVTEESIIDLIDRSSSENWTIRSETFDKFAEFAKNLETQKRIGNNLREQIIKAHVAHINDSHVKVALACMASLTKLAAIMGPQVKSQLDNIIPAVVQCVIDTSLIDFLLQLVKNLTDNREKVSNCSNFLMNVLQSTCTGDELVGPALRALETVKKTKDKVCLLELIGHIVKKCKEHFDSQGNIRQFVSKMAAIITEYPNNSQLIMPILGSLLLLREKNHKATISSIYQLPNSLQKSILIACGNYAPDLGDSIQAFMAEDQSKITAKEEQKTPKASTGLVAFRRSDKENNFERHQQTQKKTTEKVSSLKEIPKSEPTKIDVTKSESMKFDSVQTVSGLSPKNEDAKEPLTPSQENKINVKFVESSKEKVKTLKMSAQQLANSTVKDVISPSRSVLNSQKNTQKSFGQKLAGAQATTTTNEQPQVSVFTVTTQSKKMADSLEEKLEFLKKNQITADYEDSIFETNLNQLNDIDIFSAAGTRARRVYDLETLEYLINNYQEFVEIWEGRLSTILNSLFQIIRESGPKVSELGLDLLTSTMELPVDFRKNVGQLLKGLYTILPNYQKHEMIDNLWNKLFSEELRDASITQILNDLKGLDHPVTQIVIQQISVGLNGCSFEKAQKWLGNLTKIYLQLIQHSNPDIRKAVVFSLVDLSMLYKEAFLPYMEGYNQNQQKLVVIYIKRKRDKVEESGQK